MCCQIGFPWATPIFDSITLSSLTLMWFSFFLVFFFFFFLISLHLWINDRPPKSVPRISGNATLAPASTSVCDAMAKWTAQPTSQMRPIAVSHTIKHFLSSFFFTQRSMKYVQLAIVVHHSHHQIRCCISILISLHAANLPFLPLLRPFCYLITTRNRRDTCNNATLIKTKHPWLLASHYVYNQLLNDDGGVCIINIHSCGDLPEQSVQVPVIRAASAWFRWH